MPRSVRGKNFLGHYTLTLNYTILNIQYTFINKSV